MESVRHTPALAGGWAWKGDREMGRAVDSSLFPLPPLPCSPPLPPPPTTTPRQAARRHIGHLHSQWSRERASLWVQETGIVL